MTKRPPNIRSNNPLGPETNLGLGRSASVDTLATRVSELCVQIALATETERRGFIMLVWGHSRQPQSKTLYEKLKRVYTELGAIQ